MEAEDEAAENLRDEDEEEDEKGDGKGVSKVSGTLTCFGGEEGKRDG